MEIGLVKLIFLIIGFFLSEYITTKIPSGVTEMEKTYYTLLKILTIVVITSGFFIGGFLIFK